MITIRKWEANKAEAAELAERIEILLLEVYGVSPWTAEQIRADLQGPSAVYVLAEDSGLLVGFLALQVNDFEAEVLQIAVLPPYQGQGLATALFDYLPADRDVFLEVRESNQPARAFYQKTDFAEIARRRAYYHAPVEDAIIMKRERDER